MSVFDRTNSITGISAHCIARCKIVVPSSRPPEARASEEPLPSASLAVADCSLIAFEIAPVSPLRSDSKILKSFTDCSIDAPLVVGEEGDGAWFGEAGARASS